MRRPLCGQDDNCLGVRIPPHPRKDLIPDARGEVRPGKGGMSVFLDDYKSISTSILPPEHGGMNLRRVWTFSFPFEIFPSDLSLRFGSGSDHGLVEPASLMHINDFQGALCATGNSWEALSESPPSSSPEPLP